MIFSRSMLSILIFSLVFSSVLADGTRPTKAFHELYELNVGTGEGSFIKTLKFKSLTLYKEPSKKSQIVYKVDYVNDSRDHPAQFYELFDDKSGVYKFMGIYSRENRGDFYKVFYKGDYLWAHKSNFYEIVNIESLIMDPRGISANVNKIEFYKTPGGEVFTIPNSLKRYSENRTKKVDFLPKEYKWIDGVLWVKLSSEKGSCAPEGISYNEKLEFWYTPYKKGERPNYYYGYKGGC